MASGLDFAQVGLFSPRSLNLARRAKSPRCALGCSDSAVQDRFAAKWGADWRACRDVPGRIPPMPDAPLRRAGGRL